MEADKDPPRTRVESHPPPARAESLPSPARVGSHPLLTRAVNWPPQAEVGYQQPREVLSTLPPGRGGAGDSTWTDWYQITMHGAGGGISEPQGPPYLIRMAQTRWEAVGQIYD